MLSMAIMEPLYRLLQVNPKYMLKNITKAQKMVRFGTITQTNAFGS